MQMSVIVPVHNGASTLAACLEALQASSRFPDEVIVADDSSSDASEQIALAHGAQILTLLAGPHGPAVARNHAAESAAGDVLVFIDADVVVHKETLARMEAYLADQPDVAAIFGSYDAEPAAQGLVTRYKNLLHHHVHQTGRPEAETFWAGCAAIRRSVFCAVGGFSETYTTPSIEDIELGVRLRRGGHRIRLCPDVQGKHLKRWTFASWVRTDIVCRAIPWTRLIVHGGSLPNSLNLDWRGRLSALCAWCTLLLLGAGFWWPWAWLGLLPIVGGAAILNLGLLRLFRVRGGGFFAAAAGGLHLIYLFYSSLTFALIVGMDKLARYGLVLLLAAILFKGIAWSVIVPPWHSYDEPQHFLYGQSIERLRTLRVPVSLDLPRELWDSAQRAQLDTLRFHPERRITFAHPADVRRAVAAPRVASGEPATVTDSTLQVLTQARFYRYHPPFYYALLAAIQRPLEGRSIAVRLLACRWLSVLLGVGLAGIAYAAGRVLWPDRSDRPLLLGLLVGFQPMAAFTAATVTNGLLEVFVFSAILYGSLGVIRRGLTGPTALVLGGLTGLGLLTKLSLFSVLPLLGLLCLRDIARRKRQGGLWPWLIVAGLPPLISGWWYRETAQNHGDSLVASYGKITGQTHAHPLSYLWTYPWGHVYGRVLASYWGAFGSVGDAHLPRALQSLLIGLAGLAALGTAWWLTHAALSHDPAVEEQRFTLLFLGAATLCVIGFYAAVDYRIAQQLGGHFGLRGQYYLPPIIAQMAWFLFGLDFLTPRSLRPFGACLLGVGMVAVDFYALFSVLLPRYYGSGRLSDQIVRAVVLQPVNPAALSLVCLLFGMSSLALLLALGGASVTEAERRQISR